MNAESPGAAYRLFSLLLFPFWLIHAFWHGRRYDLPNYFKLRLLGPVFSTHKEKVWVHASSVGEVTAITPLIKKLIAENKNILFTSFTASGLQTIRREFPDGIESGVIPIDLLPCCLIFMRRHRIKLCLLMETELWPELLYQAAKRNIPVIQVNARLSSKTTEAPIFVRYLLRRCLSNIRLHLTRNELDRQLLIGLGASSEDIKIIGNLKSSLNAEGFHDNLVNREYILLASSHEDEEALFVEHRQEMQPLIVIAPRHPNRSQAIQKILSDAGVKFIVRSQNQAIAPDTEVYLADTLGELKALMAHAKLVVMGGSFNQTGGHNLMEPASLGCPVITGPSDSNISQDIEQLGNSIFQVDNMSDCWEKIEYLLSNPDKANQIATQAQEITRQQSNILDNYLAEIRPYL